MSNTNTVHATPSDSSSALAKINDFYGQYWSELCKFLQSRFGGGPPDPEDVAQSAFIKYADASEDRQIDNPRAFLFRTASNLIIDYHRSPKNVQPTESEVEHFELTETSDVWSPENVSMNEQELSVVERVLMALSERDRAFVLMNRLDGMTYTEIAKEAGMSRSGVQKIITQALEKCEQALC